MKNQNFRESINRKISQMARIKIRWALISVRVLRKTLPTKGKISNNINNNSNNNNSDNENNNDSESNNSNTTNNDNDKSFSDNNNNNNNNNNKNSNNNNNNNNDITKVMFHPLQPSRNFPKLAFYNYEQMKKQYLKCSGHYSIHSK